jgi:hypothetical protein
MNFGKSLNGFYIKVECYKNLKLHVCILRPELKIDEQLRPLSLKNVGAPVSGAQH